MTRDSILKKELSLSIVQSSVTPEIQYNISGHLSLHIQLNATFWGISYVRLSNGTKLLIDCVLGIGRYCSLKTDKVMSKILTLHGPKLVENKFFSSRKVR